MLWAPIIGGAATLAGAAFGHAGERKPIDPEMMKNLFGPGAVSADTMQFYQTLLNSPAFAEIMRSAGVQGASLGNRINANVAQAGVAGNPIAAFAKAAGRGYSGALQVPQMADLFMKAFGGALQNNDARMGLWGQSQLQQQATPSFDRMLGSSLLAAGTSGFDQWFQKPAGATMSNPFMTA